VRVAVGVAAAAVLLTACSGSAGTRTAVSTPTTEAVPSSSSSSSTSTTTPAPSTTATTRPTTTAPASPEAFAKALYAAWTGADRAAAEKVAQPEAVNTLFARRWQAGDGWSFSECSGAAGSLICTWRRPSGEQLLMRVQNVTGGVPVTVADVRFAAG
jgi:hypothetical protein